MKHCYVQTPNTPVQYELNIYSSLLSTSLRTLLLSLIYIHHRNRFRQKLRPISKVRRPILLNIIWFRQNFGIRIFYSIRSHNVSTTPNLTCAHRSTFLPRFVDNTNTGVPHTLLTNARNFGLSPQTHPTRLVNRIGKIIENNRLSLSRIIII